MIGPESIPVAKALGKAGLAVYGAWKNRQQDRVAGSFLKRIGHLESKIEQLPQEFLEDADSFIGKSLSIAMSDAREWKMSILASILIGGITEQADAQMTEALLTICEKIEVRHIVVLRTLHATDCDTTDGTAQENTPTMVTFGHLESATSETGELDMDLFWLSVNELVQLGLLDTRWQTANRTAKILTGISMVALLKNQAFKPTPICHRLIEHILQSIPPELESLDENTEVDQREGRL